MGTHCFKYILACAALAIFTLTVTGCGGGGDSDDTCNPSCPSGFWCAASAKGAPHACFDPNSCIASGYSCCVKSPGGCEDGYWCTSDAERNECYAKNKCCRAGYGCCTNVDKCC